MWQTGQTGQAGPSKVFTSKQLLQIYTVVLCRFVLQQETATKIYFFINYYYYRQWISCLFLITCWTKDFYPNRLTRRRRHKKLPFGFCKICSSTYVFLLLRSFLYQQASCLHHFTKFPFLDHFYIFCGIQDHLSLRKLDVKHATL